VVDNGMLRSFFFLLHIIGRTQKIIKLAWYVARVGDKTVLYQISIGDPEDEGTTWKSGHRYHESIETDSKEKIIS
jgi:hypothetical protein